MNAITVKGLTKTFGDVTAVDDLNFQVEQGELFGLLGPNGAGKSTLINVLVTLLRPTSGTARVNGHDVTKNTAAVRNSLGIVFQEQALDEELTGAENLVFHSRLYGQSRQDRSKRIEDVFDLVGLSAVKNDPVGTYSGGMKRRLEIGRGLLHEPAVLFLDEPTVGLDARTRRNTWEYIQRMNERSGVTIVLTTHYIEEAEQLCDRVAIVDNGQIAAIDTPTALKDTLGGDVVSLELDDNRDNLARRLDSCLWVNEYTVDDGVVRVTVDRGDARVADLVRLADDAGVSLAALDVHEPNLETVFLSLTGATIDERETGTADDGAQTHDGPEGPGAGDRPPQTGVTEDNE